MSVTPIITPPPKNPKREPVSKPVYPKKEKPNKR